MQGLDETKPRQYDSGIMAKCVYPALFFDLRGPSLTRVTSQRKGLCCTTYYASHLFPSSGEIGGEIKEQA